MSTKEEVQTGIAVNRTVPDEELELGAEVSILEKQVGECVITGQEDYERASDFLREIKGMQTKVKEYWEPLRVITKQAYDNILAKKKEMMTPLEKAETILKRKMGDFANEQERIKREREEAVRRLAAQEAEKNLEEAAEAESRGDQETANYAMSNAEVMDNLARSEVNVAGPAKTAGVSLQRTWRIVSIDSSQVPISVNGAELRPVDEKAVLRLIKSSKGTVNIPGVVYESDFSVSARGK